MVYRISGQPGDRGRRQHGVTIAGLRGVASTRRETTAVWSVVPLRPLPVGCMHLSGYPVGLVLEQT